MTVGKMDMADIRLSALCICTAVGKYDDGNQCWFHIPKWQHMVITGFPNDKNSLNSKNILDIVAFSINRIVHL